VQVFPPLLAVIVAGLGWAVAVLASAVIRRQPSPLYQPIR
jgi:hypothetical protein